MKLPDGPQTPALVQMIEWVFRPLEFMDACAQRYGDTFTVRVGINFAPVVFLSHPQAIQELFAADAKQLDAGRANKGVAFLLGENSLIVQDGEYHQRQRRLLTPPFHGERMRAYGQLICDITEKVISQWQEGKPFSARLSMQQISLSAILHAIFGLDEGQRYEQLKQLLSLMLDSISDPLSAIPIFVPPLQRDLGSWSPWGRFVRLKQQIAQLLYDEIEERRSQLDSSRTDILTLLLSARDEEGQPMTDAELHDELITLLVAGHETTATAVAWALYWIHYLPEVHQKLLEELDSLGDDPEISDIAKLPYLNAVCSETLRIYPVALITLPRIANSPLQVMGHQYEPETMLAGCIYLTHYREDLYPEPEKFKPERFLERQFSPYEYLPFGGGNRRCIGLAFALFEMKLVLATILRKKQLALADKRPVKPIRRAGTLAPSGGVRMVLTGQRPQNSPLRELTSSSV